VSVSFGVKSHELMVKVVPYVLNSVVIYHPKLLDDEFVSYVFDKIEMNVF